MANGDPDASDRLYELVVNDAYRVAYSVLHNRELAEEVTQEVLLGL